MNRAGRIYPANPESTYIGLGVYYCERNSKTTANHHCQRRTTHPPPAIIPPRPSLENQGFFMDGDLSYFEFTSIYSR